jgi:hypothetical protein
MRDDEFKQAMETWAESEIESAPDLRPTAEMVRLVRAKQKPRRTLPTLPRWARAGAAAAGLALIAALFALILWPGITPERTLVAQRGGPGVVQTAIVKGGGKGEGEKGPGQGQTAFRQLWLQVQQQDSPTVQAVDLLNPPEELLALTPADNYRLALELTEEQHVYVYQLTSSGSLVQIFPNRAYSAVPNPLLPGQVDMLPAEPNWLYLDGIPGKERLYVVASPQPLGDLDDLYARYGQERDADAKEEILSDLLAMLGTIAEAQPGRAVAVEFIFQHR